MSHIFAGSVPFVYLLVPGFGDRVETHQYCDEIGLHTQIYWDDIQQTHSHMVVSIFQSLDACLHMYMCEMILLYIHNYINMYVDVCMVVSSPQTLSSTSCITAIVQTSTLGSSQTGQTLVSSVQQWLARKVRSGVQTTHKLVCMWCTGMDCYSYKYTVRTYLLHSISNLSCHVWCWKSTCYAYKLHELTMIQDHVRVTVTTCDSHMTISCYTHQHRICSFSCHLQIHLT